MTPLQRLAALFAGNDTHYGTHGEPSRKNTADGGFKWIIQPTAKTLKGGYTEAHWKAHVDGKKPLGVVPIRQDSTASWGSIDYDVYGKDLTELIKKVESLKLPLVPCRSKSGGLHLFIFCLEPVPATLLQDVLRNIAAALGIADSEIFPKQSSLLVERGDEGSWMIMPYFGGDFAGKLQMQVGMRANGGEIGLPEFVRYAEKMRLSLSQLEELTTVKAVVPPAPKRKKGDKGPSGADGPGPFGDGPPCIELMIATGGIKPGGQNDALFHMAVYYKRKFPDTWQQELELANSQYLVPAGSEGGLASVTKSHTKKDYEYKCKTEPMKSHCDSIKCRMRRFGVTGGNVTPIITSIKKLNSDPPIWFVDIDKNKIECTTADLQRWDRFQQLLMEKTHNTFGVISHPVWLATVGAALQAMTKDDVIEVSHGATPEGEFHELLETFLTNRQRGQREEDLLSGRPWEDEEQARHYFSLGKLTRFLKKEGMDVKRHHVVNFVRKLGGKSEKRMVKEKELDLHWIPSHQVRSTPQVSTPNLKEKPI
jgi:hypothetical protein